MQTDAALLHLHEVPRRVRFLESESTLVDLGFGGGAVGRWGREQGMSCSLGTEFQFRKVKC